MMNAQDAMQKEVNENHGRYLARKAFNRKFGYDVEQESAFIIEKARPIWGKILEAGTGKGYFALALAREGFHFTSFDISGAAQKYALLNLMYYGMEKQVHLDIANAESLPYQDGSFDIIFSMNMIHHLSAAHRVCDEFTRVLALQGKMVLSDFNKQGLAVMEKIHAAEGRTHQAGPVSLVDMERLLKEHGFHTRFHRGDNQDVLLAARSWT